MAAADHEQHKSGDQHGDQAGERGAELMPEQRQEHPPGGFQRIAALPGQRIARRPVSGGQYQAGAPLGWRQQLR